MRRISTLLVLAVACASLIVPARAEFPRGRPAPTFTLKTLRGTALSLAALRGKVVLLDFWGPS